MAPLLLLSCLLVFATTERGVGGEAELAVAERAVAAAAAAAVAAAASVPTALARRPEDLRAAAAVKSMALPDGLRALLARLVVRPPAALEETPLLASGLAVAGLCMHGSISMVTSCRGGK